MRQPIKLNVRKSKVRNDGIALISLQYGFTAERRAVLSTGIGIPLQFWNKKTRRISSDLPLAYGNVQHLEVDLTGKLRKAEDMVAYALKQRNTCPLKFLKENFHLQDNWKLKHMSDLKKNLDVYFNIEDYVKSKESTVEHCTINVINATKAHVKSFEAFRKEPLTFDMNFYEKFVRYLTYDIVQLRKMEVIKGLKVNSVGKTIKHLKFFLKTGCVKKLFPSWI